MLPRTNLTRPVLVTLIAACVCSSALQAETRLRNICRIKGQEENTLRGLGLVVGLNGTGESGDLPTMRKLARAMELLGSPTANTGFLDPNAVEELKKVKNVCLVSVSATVPATGVRRGEKLDCTVAAMNGKSLVGGELAFAALKGPDLRDKRVYALCSGTINVEDEASPTTGRVHNGCQMEQDVYTPFYQQREDGMYITLVLDHHHASFHAAADVARNIEEDYGRYYTANLPMNRLNYEQQSFVNARDATNIEVKIPDSYTARPVAFAYEIMETVISDEDPEARVVIDRKTKTIVISGDVQIGDVVIVHNNLVVEAGTAADFTALAEDVTSNPSLQQLVDQLSALKVSESDVIEIIEEIETAGKLHGKLIMR